MYEDRIQNYDPEIQEEQWRRQGFESGGYSLRAKRAEIFFVPPAFCSLGGTTGN